MAAISDKAGNESPQDVFFDDITVKHYTGALVQEQSYYPFGVQMAAISDKALKKNNTPYKYNDGNELEEELNYYNTFYRKYDAQIGRFTGIDILSESSIGLNPYHFGANNPIYFNDPTGARQNPITHREENVWEQYSAFGPDGSFIGSSRGGGGSPWGGGGGGYGLSAATWSFINTAYANAPVGISSTDPSISGYYYTNERNTGTYVIDSYRGDYRYDSYLGEGYNYIGYVAPLERPDEESSGLLGWVQTGLDILGSTEIPILSQIGDIGSAVVSAVQGDWAGAGLSLAGAVIPGLSQIKMLRQAHHLIPNQIFREFKKPLKDMGWIQSHADNLMDLPVPFHGNHPAYNNFMRDKVDATIKSGEGLQGMIDLQNSMRNEVQSILDGGTSKLNDFFKAKGY